MRARLSSSGYAVVLEFYDHGMTLLPTSESPLLSPPHYAKAGE